MDKLETIVEQARVNEDVLHRLQRFQMRLLDAQDFNALLDVIVHDAPKTFGLQQVDLWLVDDQNKLKNCLSERQKSDLPPALKLLQSRAELEGLFEKQDKPRLEAYDSSLNGQYFSDQQSAFGSVALIPIRRLGLWIGSLHFASKDPARFNKDMATDFLQHTAAIFAVCLENAMSKCR